MFYCLADAQPLGVQWAHSQDKVLGSGNGWVAHVASGAPAEMVSNGKGDTSDE
jgi:hypothetical protein